MAGNGQNRLVTAADGAVGAAPIHGGPPEVRADALRPGTDGMAAGATMAGAVAALGAGVLNACAAAGRVALFALSGVSHLLRPPFYGRMFLRAFVEFAYFSLPVVALTAVFAGMVIALQSYSGFARFGAESAIASVVVLSVVRELAPVLGGLMVAGRVGAAMAAELGTMRVTDQIDALGTLSTDPMKYLVAPRLLAATIALPLLVLVADVIGVLGGFVIAVVKLGFNPQAFIHATVSFMTTTDVVVGLAKAAVFGFLIALMGCYHGYNSRGGAEGVGSATTSAVVSASILILSFDYVLTELFFAR
jgi:phospholipid/cholesterol/gamma-HCH transport system permease protein